MRQAVMLAPGLIEHREVPEPAEPVGHEVLLRIKNIGICGSDIHVFFGEHPATPYPVVQGHEYAAIVESVGDMVKKAKPGMRATARPQQTCGMCGPCRKGLYNACLNLKVEGFQAPGVAQDLFLVPEERLVIFPDSMSFEQGAMIEPAAVGAHATGRAGSLDGKNVVVSGSGTIGIMVAQFARIRGAGKILITDKSDFRLDLARKCGITGTLNISKTPFEEGVTRYFGSAGFQAAFEAAGTEDALKVLLQYVEKGGTVVILGVYAKNPSVNMYYLGEHELNVLGSMMYLHEDYEMARDMIASGKISTAPMITAHFPFMNFLDAYRHIEQQGDKTLKVMIDM